MMSSIDVRSPDDFKSVLGQILHHIGVEIESGSIDIHGSKPHQGRVLNYIGQLMNDANNYRSQDLLNDIERELTLKSGTYHVLELCQILLCENWEERIQELQKRKEVYKKRID